MALSLASVRALPHHSISRAWIGLLACLAALVLGVGAAAAEKRVALLIGNSTYVAVPHLPNPPRDVGLLKKTFEAAGFAEVRAMQDVSRADFIKALRSFADVAADADMAVIYFSGHGIEMAHVNYLVPVDAKLATDRDVEDEAVTLDRVLQSIEGAKKLRLVILDACRNNPFATNMSVKGAHRAIGRGLTRVEPAADTLVAYAARDGSTASDGKGENSPFAEALARRLVAPGMDVQFALRQVHDDVLAATNHEQEPWVYGALGGELISLSGTSAKMPAISAGPDCAGAEADFLAAETSADPNLLRRHAEKFAACPFASLARLKASRVQETASAATVHEVAIPSRGVRAISPVEVACDRVGANPVDVLRNPDVAGIGFRALDAVAVIAACEPALKTAATNARLQFQLGRGYQVAKRSEEAALMFSRAAAAGYPAAMANLGMLLRQGEGVPKDEALAFDWFRKASAAGSPGGMVLLAGAYVNGAGVPKNPAEGAIWYRRSADLGDVVAMQNLGWLYENGNGVPKDPGEAVKWFRKAAEAGSPVGMSNLAWALRRGEGVPIDAADAARWLKKAAALNNPGAIVALADMLTRGEGVEKDPKAAFNLLKVGADAGQSVAMNGLASAYMRGVGIDKDAVQAVAWWRKSADAGNTQGMTSLGWIYERGEGVTKSPVESATWYRKAAELGNAGAMNSYAWALKKGDGIPADKAQAFVWFRKAADLGNAAAMTSVGFALERGDGAPADPRAALDWYRRAAELGNPAGMAHYGDLLTRNIPGPADLPGSAKWLVKALGAGDEFAFEVLVEDEAKAYPPGFRAAVQSELKTAGIYAGPQTAQFDPPTLDALRKVRAK